MNDTEFLKGSNGSGEAPRLNVTALRNSGSTTLKVDSVTNWPTNFIATSGVLNSVTGIINPATIKVFKGHLSGSDIIIDGFAPGYTDTGNAVSDVVVLKPTTLWADTVANNLISAESQFTAVGTSVNTSTGVLTSAATTQASAATKTALQADANFRTKPRVYTTTSTATLTPNIDNYNFYELTAQAAGLTIANPTGTPNSKDVLMVFIKDNGVARSIAFGNAYTNISGLDTPTTTVINKWTVLGIVYNTSQPAWQIVSISQEA